MTRITHKDVMQRISELNDEYADARKALAMVQEMLAPLIEIDKQEEKLAKMYLELEQKMGKTHDRD